MARNMSPQALELMCYRQITAIFPYRVEHSKYIDDREILQHADGVHAERLPELNADCESFGSPQIHVVPAQVCVSIKLVKFVRLGGTDDVDIERRCVTFIESVDDRHAHFIRAVEIGSYRRKIKDDLQSTGCGRQNVTDQRFRTKMRRTLVTTYQREEFS